MKSAADSVKALSFELGGKNASLVFADADVEAALAGTLRSVFANTGQVSSRIIDLQPASQIVKQTWSEIETALGASRSRLGDQCAG